MAKETEVKTVAPDNSETNKQPKIKPEPNPQAPQNQNDRVRNNSKGFSIGH